MQKLFFRTPIFVLCLLFLFEQVTFAAASVAVVPFLDSSSDVTSKELASSFYNVLKLRGVEVVDAGLVDAFIDYSRPAENGDACAAGVILLNEAKEKYFTLEHIEAFALASKAVQLFNDGGTSSCGEHLRDAHIVCGIAKQAQNRKNNEANIYFKNAVSIDPSFELSEKDFSPSVVRQFTSAKNIVLQNAAGSISVDASPKVADIFLNGIFKGVSPLNLTNLPDGTYNVSARANNYISENREVTIKDGGSVELDFSLKWDRQYQNKSETKLKEVKNAILEGVRVAGILNVDKTVTIDADVNDDMSGVASIRMIDRQYRSAHKEIQVSWDSSRSELSSSLSHAADILVKQLSLNVAKSPQKYLDREGSGGVLMLGKKRSSISNGALLGIAGGLAAALGGGIAWSLLAGGGGQNAQTGSVNVRFK